MTGYIKITATTRNGHQGLEVETDVQNVSIMDRMQVLDSLCRGFKINSSELKLFMSLKSAGILELLRLRPYRMSRLRGLVQTCLTSCCVL